MPSNNDNLPTELIPGYLDDVDVSLVSLYAFPYPAAPIIILDLSNPREVYKLTPY